MGSDDALRGSSAFANALAEKSSELAEAPPQHDTQTAADQASWITSFAAWAAVVIGAPVVLAIMMKAKGSNNSMVGLCGCGCVVFFIWIVTMLDSFGVFG